MKTMIGGGIIVVACCLCALASDIPRHLVVLGGAFGNVGIDFTSPAGMIRCVWMDIGGKPTEIVAGTNVACVLALGDDGAVHGLTLSGQGRFDLDFVTHFVDGKTGATQIMNPEVVLDGKMNGIVKAWTELGKTDSCFVIEQHNRLEENGSNTGVHGSLTNSAP